MRRFIGTKKFYKEFFLIGFPIILQNLLTNLVLLIDNIMVGRLGSDAINAVGTTSKVMFILNLAIFGSLGGIGIFTSQYHGAKNTEKVKETFRLKVLFVTTISLLGILIMFLFQNQILGAFLEQDGTISLAKTYMNLIFIMIIPNAISLAISTTLREVGKPSYALYPSIIAVFTNTFLNYCFIFGNFGFKPMGIQGAAYATIISKIIEVLLLVLFIKISKANFGTRLSELFIISKSLITNAIKKALPLVANEVFWSTGVTMFFYIYSTRGETSLAGIQISESIANVMYCIYGGISVAVTIMIGSRLGANQLQEAYENSFKLYFVTFILTVTFGTILFLSAPLIANIYNVSTETKLVAIACMRNIAIFFPLVALNATMYFTFRAGGDLRSVLMMDTGYMWVVKVPCAFLIGKLTNLTVPQLMLVLYLFDFGTFSVGIYSFRRKNWLRNLVE